MRYPIDMRAQNIANNILKHYVLKLQWFGKIMNMIIWNLKSETRTIQICYKNERVKPQSASSYLLNEFKDKLLSQTTLTYSNRNYIS